MKKPLKRKFHAGRGYCKRLIRIVVITGLSGSGKSTAIKALEDHGFYCVDNLPVILLPKFIELCEESAEITRIGVGVDVRGGNFLNSFPETLKKLSASGHDVEIIFLECSDDILVKRFSETRRVHPLAPSGRISEGINEERKVLSDLKKDGKIIDTSGYNVHRLKGVISDYVKDVAFTKKMTLNLVSFGFKHGTPYDADIIMDVRFLPNPNFVDELKAFTGQDKRVSDFVLNTIPGKGFMDRFSQLIAFLVPNYINEGKSYLTIGIGCTGGRHRSVAIVEKMMKTMKKNDAGYELRVFHRDENRI